MSNNTTNSTTSTTTSPLTTLPSTTDSSLTSRDPTILTTIVTTFISTTTSNSNGTVDYCRQNYPNSTCRLAEFIQVLAYLLLAISLIPQIVHLFNHGSRYIAGISYMWIIVRVLGLTSIMVAHAPQWQSIFELIALISTLVMFTQIFIYADNFHRQQKFVLIGTSVGVWLIGGGIALLARNHETFLMITGYLLLSVHMLPQVK
jgi:hypothetical protein